jgi:iturin family lipopeptide synthetase A
MSYSQLRDLPPISLDESLEKERDYWLHKLTGELPVVGLPLDLPRPRVYTEEKQIVRRELDDVTLVQLQKLCRQNEALLFAALVTALKICLYKYTNVAEIVVGTAIHKRHAEVSSLNKILALRDHVDSRLTVKQLLLAVRQTLAEAYEHQKYPFERIINLLQIEYPNNRAPLFNVVIVCDAINEPEHPRHLKHDMALNVSLDDTSIAISIEYHPQLFQRETIQVFGDHYLATLQAIVAQPDQAISQIDLLSYSKQHELVVELNKSESNYSQRPIQQLFESQAEQTPDAIAVACADRTYSYRELNQRANQLAHYLRSLGLRRGEKVGLYLDHSPETIFGLLAVLKAGGAYVPFDAQHPKSRLAFMLKDAKIRLLLTQQTLADRLPPSEAQALALDGDLDSMIGNESTANPGGPLTTEDLAYVIYTSGSTGEPKGVQISHGALVNYVEWAKDVYLQNEVLAFPLYSSLAFDLTVTSIYTPLITGNTVFIYRHEGKDSSLHDILRENRTGVLKLTPSHLAIIKDRDNSGSRIKRMILGGEALETELARQVWKSFDEQVEIFNEYGPTEATVGCMIYKFDAAVDRRAFVPIGTPAANVQIYILDESLKPVAENIPGEIYISGDGLAQGYLNKPELTAEKFIPNPFIANRRMYKTGDLARWLPGGIIEFMGRTDDQIKYHGYRLEPNEIRCELNRHSLVRDSVVMAAKDKNENEVLVAYYVSRQEIEPVELRAFLSESVIEETIPNLFVHLKKLPLTINGKINYRALPTLEEVREKLKRVFVAPRNETEKALANIMSQVLGVEQLSIHDNFFDLGGHSLLAMQVISRIRETFEIDMLMSRLFEMPTVGGLAERIEAESQSGRKSAQQSIRRVVRDENEQLLSTIDGLSDSELDALLGQVLAGDESNEAVVEKVKQ